MASFKSVFSAGAGKVKEITGLQYNDAAGGSLDVTLPISSNSTISGSALTASGLVTGATLNIGAAELAATSFAVTATSAGGGDTALATAGYVDAQVSVIASGVSLQAFTIPASGTTITSADVGKVVCLAGGDNVPLALADKDSDLASNAIGVIKSVSGRIVTVQLDAEIAVPALGGLTTVGEPAFVGDSGAILPYASLVPGDFATQVGYVSDVAGKKIVLVLKTFGELA
jgi:hypothetical protein